MASLVRRRRWYTCTCIVLSKVRSACPAERGRDLPRMGSRSEGSVDRKLIALKSVCSSAISTRGTETSTTASETSLEFGPLCSKPSLMARPCSSMAIDIKSRLHSLTTRRLTRTQPGRTTSARTTASSSTVSFGCLNKGMYFSMNEFQLSLIH